MSEVNYQEIFDANKDLSIDECVLAIYQAGELSLKEAISEYNRLATEAGLVMSPAQKKVKFEDAVQDEEIDLSTPDGVSRAKEIGAELEISPVTVTKYIKSIASDQGVEVATVTRKPSEGVMKKIVAAIDKDTALNGERSEVIALINDAAGFDDEKKATSYYSRLRRHYGWTPGESMSQQLQDWFVNNKDATDEEIAEKAEELGMSQRSITYYKYVFSIVRNILEA